MIKIKRKPTGLVEGVLIEYTFSSADCWFECKIQDRMTREIYACTFHISLLVDIKEAFGKRVLAKGDMTSIKPISIEIDSIEVVSSNISYSSDEIRLLRRQEYCKPSLSAANNFE